MYGMNQGFNAADPSAQVPPQLLPHVHLVSCYRFPTLPSLPPAHALEYLVKGPSIVKDAAAVAWTFFTTPPPDGSVLLTWQPPRLGTHFASDGLIWADAEVAYDMNIRGYQLQVLVHKSGYHYPHEPFATHARYRYRLTNGPGAFDPNLWIVHYTMAEQALRIPSAQIPISREAHAQLAMRAQLQSTGQLIRKEFMLHDSSNWPKVEFGLGHPRGQAFYNPMQQRAQPYAPQQPPAKRPRLPTQPPARQPPPGAMTADTLLDEEENSTQDSFDFMTPREISLSRYKQHHEWMEEIFSSPHNIGKIMPIDLGLGLMGELAPLTADILDAPAGDAPIDNTGEANPHYGKKVKDYHKLEPAQLKEFEARVSAYQTQGNADLEKMKTAHAKKMADLKRSRTYIKAERRLRDVPRLAQTNPDEDSANPLDAVVSDLEKSLGVEFDTKQLVVCVDKGGFIEAQQPEKVQVNRNGTTPSNGESNGGQDGENTAASLLDQFGTGSLTGTPGANLSIPAMSQPQSQAHSVVATPSAPAGEAAHTSSFDEQAANLDTTTGGDDLLDLDVEMSGMTNADGKGGEADWVMVNQQDPTNAQQGGANTTQPPTSNDASHTSAITTSGIDAEAGGLFDAADFGSFDNLDTAGDALADYTNVDDDTMGLDLVDDSAFGDAFHGIGEGQ
ncbi:DUF1750-domain-containing protein [Lentithecium fluviatile CBS 122367]|uniref:DUF1750-domain-containing protein n=1 Tax=Lentithecium fluviatile CBS 122367 TaxID=1168545 RepID=A0A6G1JC00_9PLEO|nr:DUF1750-domain-containing protein [Lentithecium fluviatile CBS 122367]